MEKFKKELFYKEYKKEFPKYVSLEKTDCIKIKEYFIKKLDIDCVNFEKELRQKQVFCKLFNAESENFNFSNLLTFFKLSTTNDIYISWKNFEKDIDKMRTKDFMQYFTDIWFSSADDIDVFDENLIWIISVRHDGAIYYWINKNN